MTIYITINENESWYLDDNIRDHCTDPKSVEKSKIGALTATGINTPNANTGFISTNTKWSVNGYIYGNMPMTTMNKGDHVRWYVATSATSTTHIHRIGTATRCWSPNNVLMCWRWSPRK